MVTSSGAIELWLSEELLKVAIEESAILDLAAVNKYPIAPFCDGKTNSGSKRDDRGLVGEKDDSHDWPNLTEFVCTRLHLGKSQQLNRNIKKRNMIYFIFADLVK